LLGLVFAAAGLARKVRIQVRPSWEEPVNLFGVVALPPGERKSAVFDLAIRPVQAHERYLRQQQGPAILQAESELRLLQDQQRVLERRISRAAPGTAPTALAAMRTELAAVTGQLANLTVPPQPRCFVDDESAESLGQVLVEHGGRMLVAAPEGTPFENATGRYTNRPNFEVYLKGHAGDSYRSGRIGRGRDSIDRPALSVALAVQPDVVRGLAEHASLKARGFLARFLYAIPRSMVGRRAIAQPGVEPHLQDDYEKKILALWRVGYADGDAPHLLRFSAEADTELQAFERWLEPQMRPDGGVSDGLTLWMAKLAGACARIAGVLHVTGLAKEVQNGQTWTDWTKPVGLDSVKSAIRLGKDYLLPHAQAAVALLALDKRANLARRVLKWVVSRPEPQQRCRFTERDAYRVLRYEVNQVEDVAPVLTLLERHGLICREPPAERRGPGRSPSPGYLVHPQAADALPGDSVLSVPGPDRRGEKAPSVPAPCSPWASGTERTERTESNEPPELLEKTSHPAGGTELRPIGDRLNSVPSGSSPDAPPGDSVLSVLSVLGPEGVPPPPDDIPEKGSV
jgi:hypothetical protein